MNCKRGICVKCFNHSTLYSHHFVPRRFFGNNRYTALLCSRCHTKADALISGKRMKIKEYILIFQKFLGGAYEEHQATDELHRQKTQRA